MHITAMHVTALHMNVYMYMYMHVPNLQCFCSVQQIRNVKIYDVVTSNNIRVHLLHKIAPSLQMKNIMQGTLHTRFHVVHTLDMMIMNVCAYIHVLPAYLLVGYIILIL